MQFIAGCGGFSFSFGSDYMYTCSLYFLGRRTQETLAAASAPQMTVTVLEKTGIYRLTPRTLMVIQYLISISPFSFDLMAPWRKNPM